MTAASGPYTPARGVSRRRLIQGAAWATPAILIATSAPAAAASTSPAVISMIASRSVEPIPIFGAYDTVSFTVTRVPSESDSTVPVTDLMLRITAPRRYSWTAVTVDRVTAGFTAAYNVTTGIVTVTYAGALTASGPSVTGSLRLTNTVTPTTIEASANAPHLTTARVEPIPLA